MLGSKIMSWGAKPTSSVSNPVGTLADGDLALDGVGLSLFVECHDDDGGPVSADDARLSDETRPRPP